MTRRGLTLLETMVALVILGIVVVAFLEVLGGSMRLSGDADRWSRAVAFGEDGMESLAARPPAAATVEALGGGYSRRVATRPWSAHVDAVTVTVTLPDGSLYRLDRLVRRQ